MRKLNNGLFNKLKDRNHSGSDYIQEMIKHNKRNIVKRIRLSVDQRWKR